MKYLIGLILSILVIIFIIIRLLSGGNSSPSTPQLPPQLSSYAQTDVKVRYTIDNRTQADQTHRDIIITVGKDSAELSITGGYNGNVIKSQSYTNNPAAYAALLLGLDKTAGFTLGNNDAKVQDERGYCATGSRFLYEIIDSDGSVIQHLWSTNCGQKTYKGNVSATETLFQAQIPDYDEFVQGVSQ